MKKFIFLFGMLFLANCCQIPIPLPVEKKPQQSASATPSNTVTPSPVPSVIASVQPTALPPIASSTPVPTPIITPVPVPSSSPNSIKDVNYLYLSVNFKEEFRVRFDKQKKEFFSRTGADVSSLNNLFKQYDVTEIYDRLLGRTEEQADAEYEQAKSIPTNPNFTPPVNSASSFRVATKDTIFKEFIEKLRKELLVREVGENAEIGPH